MKTPEQLKGTIRSMAEKKNLRAQEILQMFLFERVLERLAHSAYKNNFILKGGLLISSMIGISERTTMDMDTTVRGIQMEEDEIIKAIKEILDVDVDDGILFEYKSIEPIREDESVPVMAYTLETILAEKYETIIRRNIGLRGQETTMIFTPLS